MIGLKAENIVGYWPLVVNQEDHSSYHHGTRNHGVVFQNGSAHFNGISSFLEIDDSDAINPADRSFTISAWINIPEQSGGPIGDIAAKYDSRTRTGFNLSVVDHSGMTYSQANHRNLQFGIDAGSESSWEYCGHPGDSIMIAAMAVNEGDLYIGTCERGEKEIGRVYRYESGTAWKDMKLPCSANCVSSLASSDGVLYAASGRYDTRGSALGLFQNETSECFVWRFEKNGTWTNCGRPGDADDLMVIAFFNRKLYALPNYSRGFFCYEEGKRWKTLQKPIPRFFAMAPYRHKLYAASNRSLRDLGPPPEYEIRASLLPDADGVYRFDDDKGTWEGCGPILEETQMYSFLVHQGRLHVGTWPNGKVFSTTDGKKWKDLGQVQAEEKEVMAMAQYNGKMFVGTLPMANVLRFDGENEWIRVGKVDDTPDVEYRRAWSMAVHNGKLFVGALPSGKVFSMEAGLVCSDSSEMRAGWQHISAVRDVDKLSLYINGELRSQSASRRNFDLSNNNSLRLGFGEYDYFTGNMKEVVFFDTALEANEIKAIHSEGA